MIKPETVNFNFSCILATVLVQGGMMTSIDVECVSWRLTELVTALSIAALAVREISVEMPEETPVVASTEAETSANMGIPTSVPTLAVS